MVSAIPRRAQVLRAQVAALADFLVATGIAYSDFGLTQICVIPQKVAVYDTNLRHAILSLRLPPRIRDPSGRRT